MLVEKGDDQEKTQQQKNFKNRKFKTQMDDSSPDITKEMEEEIYKIKKMLKKCNSLMKIIQENMEDERKKSSKRTHGEEKKERKEGKDEKKEDEEKEETEGKEERKDKITNKLPKRENLSNKFTTDEINIAVVNSGGLNGNKESINNFINKFDIRICIMSETHTAGKEKPHLNNQMTNFFNNRGTKRNKGDVAIAVENSIAFSPPLLIIATYGCQSSFKVNDVRKKGLKLETKIIKDDEGRNKWLSLIHI